MRKKTNITCRKEKEGFWYIKKGKERHYKGGPGIYGLLALVCKIIKDREKIHAIDVQIRRK